MTPIELLQKELTEYKRDLAKLDETRNIPPVLTEEEYGACKYRIRSNIDAYTKAINKLYDN